MPWQDLVIMSVTIVFSAALIPQIWSGFKTKTGPISYQTSIPTFIGLYTMSFTYITLRLYFSSVITFLTGTLWLTLCIQRLIYKDKNKTTVAPPSTDF
ncbi:MAG: hypothetical protein HYY51_03435 [Candidatus Magasanikbacteria bacterium]|nr:hypothetical protein [Candidatus Magasanikbacteria bacterium]